MKTIYTTLPIYNTILKQSYNRSKNSRQQTDRPISVVCPRHRLPAFQWKDAGDGATYVDHIELVNKEYDGSEVTLATNWDWHHIDTLFNHTGLEITQGKNVGGGVWDCYTGTFSVNIGDIIRLRGILAGSTGTYPVMYLGNNAGYTITMHDGTIDITLRVQTAGVTELYMAGVGAIDFSFTGVTITKVSNIKELYYYMPYIPFVGIVAFDNDYFYYSGGALNQLLDPGDYYLKIYTNSGHVYYSEWFRVDCIYENLITEWTGYSFETFTSSGTAITSAINSAGSGWATTNEGFLVANGEVITVTFNINLTSGTIPDILLENHDGTINDTQTIINGPNTVQLTAAWDGIAYITFYKDTTNYNFQVTEVMAMRGFSTKYLTLNFSNVCDLGDILYHHNFAQTLWYESEAMEPSYPMEEEGVKDGNGQFVRSFVRQVKKYISRTKAMPDYMVDVFNRMKLHDSIQIIDLFGDTNTIYNLEVEHEWLDTDKYYARFDLTFDYNEAVILAGCCNNIV